MPHRREPRFFALGRAAGFALPREAAGRALDFAATAGRLRGGVAHCFPAPAEVVTLAAPPEPLDSAGFGAPSVAGAFVSAFDSSAGFDSSRSTARLRLSSLSDLKSVSYQPLPFRR